MAYKFLYYPTIAVPDGAWLRRVLLYSDQIGTIVPFDARQDLSREMRMLREEDEVTFISPESHMWEIRDGLQEEIEGIVKTPAIGHKLAGPYVARKTMRIHESKLSWYITEMFRDLGLLSTIKDRYGYFEIDHALGTIYMGTLAKHLGRVHGFTPCTDQSSYERLVFNVTEETDLHPVASVKLRSLLPTPADNTPLGEIIAFKRQRTEELLNLRRKLRALEKDLKAVHSREAANDIIEQFNEDIKLEGLRMQRLMGEAGINFVMTSIKYLMDAKPSTVGIASAFVQIATSLVKGGRERAIQELNSPFSYVFNAEQAFGRGCCHWSGRPAYGLGQKWGPKYWRA